jgi:hypothetical protein
MRMPLREWRDVLGTIMERCETVLAALGGGKPVELNDYMELGRMVHNKMHQIRNKIFETG